MLDKPINTDKQADRAARRVDRLNRRKDRIEQRRDVQVEKLEARIKKIKANAAERIEQVDAVRVPLRKKLIHFVTVVRERRQKLTLSTGSVLEVFTNYKVVTQNGDDDAAVAELEAKGKDEYVRVKKEPNRQLLAQKAHRHIVDEMERLSLEPVHTLKITLAQK